MLVRHMTHPKRVVVPLLLSFEEFKDACCDAMDVLRQDGLLYLLPNGSVKDRVAITATTFTEVSASWVANPGSASTTPVWLFDPSEEVAKSGASGAVGELGCPSLSKRSPEDDLFPAESATDRSGSTDRSTDRSATTAYSRDPRFTTSVRGRDGGKCCVCGVAEPLEAAHIVGLDSSFDYVADSYLGSNDISSRNIVTYVRLIIHADRARVVHNIRNGPVYLLSQLTFLGDCGRHSRFIFLIGMVSCCA